MYVFFACTHQKIVSIERVIVPIVGWFDQRHCCYREFGIAGLTARTSWLNACFSSHWTVDLISVKTLNLLQMSLWGPVHVFSCFDETKLTMADDALWWDRSGSTLAQVMACCLMAPGHYLNHSVTFYKRYLSHQSLKLTWKLLILNFIQIAKGPIS